MAPGPQAQAIIASPRLPAPSGLASTRCEVLLPSPARSTIIRKPIVVVVLAPPLASSARFIRRNRVGVGAGITGPDLLHPASSIRLLRPDPHHSTRSSTSTVRILERARHFERRRRGGPPWTNRLCPRLGEQGSLRPDQAMQQDRHQHSSLRRGRVRSPAPAQEEASEGRAGRSRGVWSRRVGRQG